ncbi:MmgE/PrpD family protein [Bosea sp. 2YAB26]|uniref:MmgE/PrpD family protein n=1 Tax=Bosea sp. 2YAB26 TaxID=3237478 RepID=UPI003F933447
MIKRLHTARASEGGVMAARLAAAGFSGPDVILEGKFGFFEAFTRAPKLDELLRGLGETWETERICTKCYPLPYLRPYAGPDARRTQAAAGDPLPTRGPI